MWMSQFSVISYLLNFFQVILVSLATEQPMYSSQSVTMFTGGNGSNTQTGLHHQQKGKEPVLKSSNHTMNTP